MNSGRKWYMHTALVLHPMKRQRLHNIVHSLAVSNFFSNIDPLSDDHRWWNWDDLLRPIKCFYVQNSIWSHQGIFSPATDTTSCFSAQSTSIVILIHYECVTRYFNCLRSWSWVKIHLAPGPFHQNVSSLLRDVRVMYLLMHLDTAIGNRIPHVPLQNIPSFEESSFMIPIGPFSFIQNAFLNIQQLKLRCQHFKPSILLNSSARYSSVCVKI